jgi:hypothetical protein
MRYESNRYRQRKEFSEISDLNSKQQNTKYSVAKVVKNDIIIKIVFLETAWISINSTIIGGG